MRDRQPLSHAKRTRFLSLGSKRINDQFFYVPTGVGPIQPGGNARFIRDVFAESYRGLGLGGAWSSDGQTLFINDGHDTRKLRETAVTVHDETGNLQATLRTGAARRAEIIAVADNGQSVVTCADIDHRPIAKANEMHRRIQLWTLR